MIALSLLSLGCVTDDSRPQQEQQPPTEECTSAWFADADGDGHGDATSWVVACEKPLDHVETADDCDDASATVHPLATEVCNGTDDDCDGSIDLGAIDAPVWFADRDDDGAGDEALSVTRCDAPVGHVEVAGDCDDTDASIRPGATELCNGVDDDCDSLSDSLDPDVADAGTWYADTDGDRFGDAGSPVQACVHPEGTVEDATDCDDAEPAAYPEMDERCDGIDNDCDGLADDDDPGAVDGTQTFYVDADGDLLGDPAVTLSACIAPAGWTDDDTDCDDTDGSIGGPMDWYYDGDRDGYGIAGLPMSECTAVGPRWVNTTGDCDDEDDSVSPDATEVCNERDDNCDGTIDDDDPLLVATTWYADDDEDGFGDDADAVVTCETLEDRIVQGGDCDDSDLDVYPDAPELCDSLDNDCDGSIDETIVYLDWFADDDGDAFGDDADSVNDCVRPIGYVLASGDCDDAVSTTWPGAREVCNNGADDDCDGTDDNCGFEIDDARVTIDTVADSYPGFGSGLATGDLDGDGMADLVIGDEYNGSGEAVILFGPLAGATTREDGIAISTPETNAQLGSTVVVGDADEDGSDDLLVAESFSVGQAYVFFGPITASTRVTDADTTYVTTVPIYGDLGHSMEVVEDFDGDGARDLVHGSPHNTCIDASGDEVSLCGAVYVLPAASAGEVVVDTDATHTFVGGSHAEYLGDVVSQIGDTTGDGLTDLAIAAPKGEAQCVYLIDGGASPGSFAAADVASGAIVSDGIYEFDRLTITAADYDDDGYVDLFLGTQWSDGYVGSVLAFLGPVAGAYTEGDADVHWETSIPDAHLGDAVATSDADGDGEMDVLMGSSWVDDFDGAVYLQFGKAGGTVDVESLPAFHFPAGSGGSAGRALRFLDDWGTDGLPEMAVGAPYWSDETGAGAGKVWVFFSDDLF